MINIIAAVAENGVIGNNGKLPWNLKLDMARFKQITMGNVVIFGKNTFSSHLSLLLIKVITRPLVHFLRSKRPHQIWVARSQGLPRSTKTVSHLATSLWHFQG